MNLPSLKDLDVKGKRVIVRADLDFNLENYQNNPRFKSLLPSLNYLLDKAYQIVIISHRGRPTGEDNNLSLLPSKQILENIFSTPVIFIPFHDLAMLHDSR